MNLPFSQAQFFEVFAAYNLALWPAQVALNVLAMAMLAVVLWAPRRAGRLVSLGAGVALDLAGAGLPPGILLEH